MSAPLNQPQYENLGDEPPPTPEDPRWTRSGTYVEPTYADLSASGIPPAPRTALPSLGNQLGEDDYARGRFASGTDVDHHINTDEVHGPRYGEIGPRPYPN